MTSSSPAIGDRTGLAALAVAVGVSAYTGFGLATGAPRTQALVPLFATAGLGLLLLALIRFTAFVVAVLVLRASLDIAKLGGSLDVTRQAGDPAAPEWLDPGTVIGVLFIAASVGWLLVQERPGRSNAGGAPPEPRIARAASGGSEGVGGSSPHHGPGLLRLSPVAAGWALAGAGLLSMIAAREPGAAAGEVLRIGTAVLMILVVARLAAEDPGRRPLLLGAALAAAGPPVVMTILQVTTGTGLVDVHGTARPRGTFWHPNMLGVFSALLLVMTVALLTWAWRPGPPGGSRPAAALRAGLVPPAAGLAFALVMSGTRGAWLAALAGLAVVGVLQDRRVLYGMGAAVAAVAVLVPSVRDRFGDLSAAQGAAGAPENSLAWRLEHWQRALEHVWENPVTGVGLGGAVPLLGKEVHNDYLRALLEAGVLGLAAFLAFLLALALTARRALRAVPAGASPERALAVGFAGCVAVAGVFAVADNLMTSVVVLLYLAAFTGLAASLDGERP